MSEDRRETPRLLRWNVVWNTPRVRWCLTLIAFALALTTYLVHTSWRHTLNGPPPTGGDAPVYDSLGWELNQEGRFQVDFADPEFQRPYRVLPPADRAWPDNAAARGLTTARPPLMPLVMAAMNRVLGRQFWGIRVVNMCAMACVCALVVWTVCRLAGPVPAVVAAFQFVIVDWRTREYARDVLTESLACLAVAGLTLLLFRMAAQPKIRTAALCGVVAGLAVLLRTMFVLWLPGLALAVLCIAGMRRHRWRDRSSLLRAGAFLISSLAICMPWFVRNCVVLGRFQPLGLQGQMELSAGYSDESFRHGGMWFNLESSGFYDGVITADMPVLDREIAAARFSRAAALRWIAHNPLKLPLLAVMKVVQEFRPHGPGELYILGFAGIGLLLLWGRPDAAVLLAVLANAALAVSLTWSTSGRFVVPALFALHTAAAVGVWGAVTAVTARRAEVLQAAGIAELERRNDS